MKKNIAHIKQLVFTTVFNNEEKSISEVVDTNHHNILIAYTEDEEEAALKELGVYAESTIKSGKGIQNPQTREMTTASKIGAFVTTFEIKDVSEELEKEFFNNIILSKQGEMYALDRIISDIEKSELKVSEKTENVDEKLLVSLSEQRETWIQRKINLIESIVKVGLVEVWNHLANLEVVEEIEEINESSYQYVFEEKVPVEEKEIEKEEIEEFELEDIDETVKSEEQSKVVKVPFGK